MFVCVLPANLFVASVCVFVCSLWCVRWAIPIVSPYLTSHLAFRCRGNSECGDVSLKERGSRVKTVRHIKPKTNFALERSHNITTPRSSSSQFLEGITKPTDFREVRSLLVVLYMWLSAFSCLSRSKTRRWSTQIRCRPESNLLYQPEDDNVGWLVYAMGRWPNTWMSNHLWLYRCLQMRWWPRVYL